MAAVPSSGTAPKPSRVQSCPGGSRETDTEGSNISSGASAGPIYQPDICCSQEGREISTGGEPEGSEPVHEASPLQNGRPAEGSPPEGGLDGIHRLEGCIFVTASGTETQTPPTVHVGRPTLPVSVSPIRAFHCSTSVYQGNETSDASVTSTWNPGHNIPGRHASDGPEKGRFEDYNPGDCHLASYPGLLSQLFSQPWKKRGEGLVNFRM